MPDNSEKQNNEDNDNEKKTDARCDTIPEKVTLWLSVAIVLVLFGFLGFHGWHAASPGSEDASPRLTVTVESQKTRPIDKTHWYMPVIVHNAGNLAMEEVQVQVNLTGKAGKEQTVDLTFAYLAEGATEDAFIIMDVPPAEAKPEATVMAFKTQRRARGY